MSHGEHAHPYEHDTLAPVREVMASVARADGEDMLRHEALCGLSLDVCVALDVTDGDLAVVSTEAGRSLVMEVSSAGDASAATIQVSSLARQSLRLRIGQEVWIGRVETGTVREIMVSPYVDVSAAADHGLEEHVKAQLIARRVPISSGLVVYLRYPGSVVGTIYRVTLVEGEPGFLTEDADVRIEYTSESVSTSLLSDVTFDDVGGLDRQIQLVRELVEVPLRYPERYRAFGILPPRGVLFFGPPGTGKTHLARALAAEVDARFYYINGPEIVGTAYGETEDNLRRIFSEATHHAPSLIFIDEIDAVAPKRSQVSTQSDTRMVTQLLSLMDGLRRADGVMVIGTTNRIDSLETALRRPGRFDREIFFSPPGKPAREAILQVHAREMPLSNAALDFLPTVAERTPGFVGADLMEICREAGLNALRRTIPGNSGAQGNESGFVGPMRVEVADFNLALSHIRPSASRETLAITTDTSWADVGGLAEVKGRLRQLIQLPLEKPEAFEAMGLRPPTGVVLYGPSGCGKTLLARALATACNANFVPVQGPEIFKQWLGESEEQIRHIFMVARHLAPSIVFLDQLDALVPARRGEDGTAVVGRIISQLIAELDDLRALSGTVVLAATNRLDLVEPALLRPGRLGTHLFVGLPGPGDRREILTRMLGAALKPGGELDAMLDLMAAETDGLSGADLGQLIDEAKLLAVESGSDRPELRAAHLNETMERYRAGHLSLSDTRENG